MEISIEKKDTTWLDIIRFIATIAVIVIHVTAPYIYQYGSIPMAQWNFYNVVDSLSRFAVPFFVMLSGALLMNKEIQLADFLKRRFVRILIPFLFWSIVYSVYNYYKLNIENKMNISTYMLDCFTNGASYHLWYIYMLIGLYLLIPILGKWIQTSSDSSINYFILIWIVFLSIRFFEIPLHKDFTFTIFKIGRAHV